MRRHRDRDGMVEVELVEVGDLDVDAATPADDAWSGDDPIPPRPARRQIWWWLAVGVAVVLTVVGASVHEAFRAREDRVHLTSLHGMVHPLTAAPTEAWRSDGAAWAVPVGGGVLLVPLAFQEPTLQLVEPTSGVVRWNYDLGTGRARTDTSCGGRRWVSAGPREPSPDTVVCLVWSTSPGDAAVDPATGELVDPETAAPLRLLVLDTRTGALVRRVALETWPIGYEQLGSDVVLATPGRDGSVVIRREDARTGAERWVHREPRTRALDAPMEFGMEHGVGILHRERTTLAIDLDTGEPLHRWATPQDQRGIAVLPAGGFAVFDRPGRTSTVLDRDGTERFTIRGQVIVPTTTDVSLPDVLVIWDRTTDVLIGVDARTGVVQWRWAPPEWLGVPTWPVQVDGTLVLMDTSGIAALDVRNGHQRWAVQRPTDQIGPVLTTGSSVLFTEGHSGLDELLSISLADGSVEWTTDLPDDVGVLIGVGGTLMSVFGHDVIALR